MFRYNQEKEELIGRREEGRREELRKMGESPLGLGLNSTMCYHFTIWTIHYTKVYFLPSSTPMAQDCSSVPHHTVVLLVFQPRVSFFVFLFLYPPLSSDADISPLTLNISLRLFLCYLSLSTLFRSSNKYI